MSVPFVKSLVLCETVVCDQFTDKWSLIGVFTTAFAKNFPVLLPKLCCYAAVSDVHGSVHAQFRLLDPELNELRKLSVPPLDTTRRLENEFGGVFAEVLFTTPGRYSVEFLIDGKLLQTAKIDVAQAPAHMRNLP